MDIQETSTVYNKKKSMEHLSTNEKRIGHRRVSKNGIVTYKKRPTDELMQAVQLGISQSVGTQYANRDILYEDFSQVLTVNFPSEGSSLTPAHHCSHFCFRSYAPTVFRYFRNIFKIRQAEFLLSLCSDPLRELPNPGASGSIFYVTQSEEFIIKTVQHKEAEFLQKLLPGYYMNLNQNPCTLLPKFYGLYCYQSGGKNIRFVVMNNIITSDLPLYCKFDLKGSTYKRRASRNEKNKQTPTLKDLDYTASFPEGMQLDSDSYDALSRTLDRDCRVLESFKIMDYSILIGVHKMEKDNSRNNTANETNMERHKQRHRIGQFQTTVESIQAPGVNYTSGQLPALDISTGEKLMLSIGIIDILQSYRMAKKFEHAFKAVLHDGDTISVHHPSFYAERFKKFCLQVVFKSNKGSKKSNIHMKGPMIETESMPSIMKALLKKQFDMNLHSNSTSSLLSATNSTFTQRTDAATSFTASSLSGDIEDHSGSASRDPSIENQKTSSHSSVSSTHHNYDKDLSQLSFSPIIEQQYNDHHDHQNEQTNSQFLNQSKNNSFDHTLSQDVLNNLSINPSVNTTSLNLSSTASNYKTNGVCSSNVNFARKNSKKYLTRL